ncbi:MAG: hypothetical protein CMI54_03540 [Parcubacteria group bacterium]|jgi:hypothetical protein|nr:hypothetical protein [Parcubacteria group bacterium]|tara:strand:- start:1813 stop:2367 length:555 start_codon:yes stop_codon:yes gene_type:complete
MEFIKLENKVIRSYVIKNYLGDNKCFCFSCGNASKALRDVGVNVIGISPYDKLNAVRYIEPKEGYDMFNCFNATSGCLPLFLISQIADKYCAYLHDEVFRNDHTIYVPVGSGETLFAMSFLFPVSRMVGVTSKKIPAIKFESQYSPIADYIKGNYVLMDINRVSFEGAGYFIDTGVVKDAAVIT